MKICNGYRGYKIYWSKDKNVSYDDGHNREYVFLDGEMLAQGGFCDGCEAVDEEIGLGFESCPAMFYPLDEACIRRHYLEEVMEIVAALNERLDAVCFDRNSDIYIDYHSDI